jgi:hypothetical protein
VLKNDLPHRDITTLLEAEKELARLRQSIVPTASAPTTAEPPYAALRARVFTAHQQVD